jgi:flagellar biosynthesis protein FlhG
MPLKSTQIVSIGSGKGGVGKTLTTIHLAMAAAAQSQKVLIIDGDLGLANVDVILGLKSAYSLQDVLEDRVAISDILLKGPQGIHIVPSGSGFARLASLTLPERLKLVDQLESIAENYDLILIDTGAGIHPNVLHLNSVADRIVVVTTPEPHAMTDAYAFIKVMAEEYSIKQVNLLVNKVISQAQGLKVGERIAEVGFRYLGLSLNLLGSVPKDDMIQRSVMTQGIGFERSTHTVAGQAWNEIGLSLFDSGFSEPSSAMRRQWMDLAFPNAQVSSSGSLM